MALPPGAPSTANRIIRGISSTVILEAFETYALAQYPALNLPIIKPLFEELMARLTNDFATYLGQKTGVAIMDSQIDQEERNYDQAEAALRAAGTDPIALAKATLAFESSLRALIRCDGGN